MINNLILIVLLDLLLGQDNNVQIWPLSELSWDNSPAIPK